MIELEAKYRERYEKALVPIASNLQTLLSDLFDGVERIDRISVRAKTIERFIGKSTAQQDGKPKYEEPLNQIQDQIGARIITFYRDDVDRMADLVLRYFRSIERQNISPEKEWEFGYFGQHHILLLDPEVIDPELDQELVPNCFELQIKTLFQHAWSEANHDLGYKPGQRTLESDDLRQLAFTSAQAWGADRVFNDLFQRQANPKPEVAEKTEDEA